MARTARLVVPGFPHHVTQRGSRGQRTFFGQNDYKMYLDLVVQAKAEIQIEIWAYCLMPNHVHLIAVPARKDALSKFFRSVHSKYARLVNKREGWQGHLWQERFHSFVMDETHLLAAARYVELNPVRAGLCRTAYEWPWSSARTHLLGVNDGIVNSSVLQALIRDWSQFLGERVPDSEVEELRVHSSNGFPLGPAQFVEKLENMTGRSLRKKKPGPKKIR